ncbi:hypothetical protein ABT116_47380, partial [Streptomyces sp. NPDC002130]|uniref:hypothetical protein n=1 Tax=Streptomyces sp. NPDC002130 TaxID=3155568 RepID=UPI00332450AF
MVTQGGRKYAQLLKSIWNDTDWRALSRDAQWLYELLISQSSMNYAGVLDLTIRRWSNLACDTTPADVTRHPRRRAELQEHRHRRAEGQGRR